MSGRILLDLHVEVAPDRREAFLGFLAEAFPKYEAPGTLVMTLVEQVDAPGTFIERVAYQDRAAFEADQARMDQDPEMKALLARWRTFLKAPPRVVVHREVLG